MIPKDMLVKLVAKLALTYTGEKEYEKPKSGIHSKKEKDDGIKTSQRMLLTWLIDDKSIYSKIEGIVTERDFTTELYKEVAKKLFEQFRNGENNPAKIINSFDNEDEQNEVARLFNTPLPEELDIREKERALNEIVKNVKKNSLDELSRNATDIEVLQTLINEQMSLEKIHISLM